MIKPKCQHSASPLTHGDEKRQLWIIWTDSSQNKYACHCMKQRSMLWTFFFGSIHSCWILNAHKIITTHVVLPSGIKHTYFAYLTITTCLLICCFISRHDCLTVWSRTVPAESPPDVYQAADYSWQSSQRQSD